MRKAEADSSSGISGSVGRLAARQVKEILYDVVAKAAPGAPPPPRVVGKQSTDGARHLHEEGELSQADVAAALAGGLRRVFGEAAAGAVAALPQPSADALAASGRVAVKRGAYFCAGCPHSSSTRVPAGARALMGVGCHYLAVHVEGRSSKLCSQVVHQIQSWAHRICFFFSVQWDA